MYRTTIALTAAALLALPAFADGTKKDIVDTAVEAGSFSTLVAAVQAAGLVDTLKGDGPFTVFAPTDEAFAKAERADISGSIVTAAASEVFLEILDRRRRMYVDVPADFREDEPGASGAVSESAASPPSSDSMFHVEHGCVRPAGFMFHVKHSTINPGTPQGRAGQPG